MPELTFEDLFPAALVTQFNLHYSGIPQTSPERQGWNFGLSTSFVCAGQGGLATPARTEERFYIKIYLYLWVLEVLYTIITPIPSPSA